MGILIVEGSVFPYTWRRSETCSDDEEHTCAQCDPQRHHEHQEGLTDAHLRHSGKYDGVKLGLRRGMTPGDDEEHTHDEGDPQRYAQIREGSLMIIVTMPEQISELLGFW